MKLYIAHNRFYGGHVTYHAFTQEELFDKIMVDVEHNRPDDDTPLPLRTKKAIVDFYDKILEEDITFDEIELYNEADVCIHGGLVQWIRFRTYEIPTTIIDCDVDGSGDIETITYRDGSTDEAAVYSADTFVLPNHDYYNI